MKTLLRDFFRAFSLSRPVHLDSKLATQKQLGVQFKVATTGLVGKFLHSSTE